MRRKRAMKWHNVSLNSKIKAPDGKGGEEYGMKYKARLLGRPELFADGEPCAFTFKKAQMLALMLAEERSISKDKICEYLWAGKTIEKARRNLSNALSCVKKFLPISVAGGVVSLCENVRIERDVDLLSKIETLGWSEITPLCRPYMDAAEVDSWGAFSDWLLPKRQHYHNVLVKNLKKRAQAQLAGFAQNRFEDALLCYEKLSECEPYDEKIHGELVRLYIKTNQKVKAIDVARAFSRRIAADFGIETDLSDISTLMRRRSEGPDVRAQSQSDDENPLKRSGEIMKMLGFFTDTADRRPLCGMVWGEQGVGKTVFVSEITSRLAERGWECFSVSCRQEEKSGALAAVMRLLKSMHIQSPRLKNITSISDLSYSCITELIHQRFAALPRGMKRLLVVEDLQWMDDASWNVLESVMCDESASFNMLVSGFEEIRHAFMLRTALADEPFEKFELTLRSFSLEETGRICRDAAPDDNWTDERIHDVYMQTDGNPFLIRELIRGKTDCSLSDGSRSKYLSTIDLLDDNERLFLEAIAVCPERASMKEIASVLEMSPLALSKLYANMRFHGFLSERETDDGDVHYYLTHTKLRERLLSGMSASRRAALHAKNVEILEAEMPNRLQYRHKEICARLCHHCREARMAKRGLYWRVRWLELHFAAVHEVFPTFVDQDLTRYIPTADETRRTRTELAEAWAIMDRLFRAEGGDAELLRLERDLYTLKGGYLRWCRRYEDAENMLRAALRKAIATGEPEAVIKAGVQLCCLAIQRDDAKMLSFCSKKLLNYTRRTGFKIWEGTALRYVGMSRVLQSRFDEAEKYLTMSSSVFEKLEERGENYTACIIAADCCRADALLAQNKINEALALYENCVNIGESVSLFRGLGLSLSKAALCLMLLGRGKEAELRLQRMGKIYNIIHTEWEDGLQGGGIAFSLMGVLNCRKKDWRRAAMCLNAAKRLVAETKRPLWEVVLCWAMLELWKMEGELPKDFAESVITHPRSWYETRLTTLKHKVGWI